jgi:uncharacterized membrane protein
VKIMKKQIISRGIQGIPMGITIGYLITVFSSLGWADGHYVPCVPELAEQLGSQINAVILQTVLCAILGVVFGAASAIWEIEKWSIAKQTGVYFLIIAITMLPIAYIACWMEHTIVGFLIYFGIFFAIFIVIWISQYLIWKSKIKKIGERVAKQ